jgi:hypothetical protein
VLVEAHGIAPAVVLTGGDRNDVTHLIPPLEAVAPIRGKRGRSLRRPKHLYADRGYDHDVRRDRVRRFEITPHIARRGTEHGSGLGVHRRVVEGAVALLHWFRRTHPLEDPRRRPSGLHHARLGSTHTRTACQRHNRDRREQC